MAVSPKDILEKEFNTKFKGYDPEEVDAFLDEVMTELAYVIEEKRQLEMKVASLENDIAVFREQESKMSEAEERIMTTVLAAQRNAQMYLSKVEAQAQGIMDGAVKNAKTIIEGAQIKMENIRSDMQKYQQQVQDYKDRFRAFLDDQYTHMNNNIDQSEIQKSVSDITKVINRLQEEIAYVDNQSRSMSVDQILAESAEMPKEEVPVKNMDEIRILVDELDSQPASEETPGGDGGTYRYGE